MTGTQAVFALFIVLLTGGCASSVERIASKAAFTDCIATGGNLPHRIFHNLADRTADRLHVYIEGDGQPWLRRQRIAADPTPRRPLMLELMSLDDAPSVYLGRPCYHGLATRSLCSAELWTFERYSETVLDGMEAVLRSLMARHHIRQIDLFGHSGGGALAMLLAERFADSTVTVVTLAGNLDSDAWSRHHGYTPLYGSLNPANRPPLTPDIRQFHYAGNMDRQVPPDLIRPVVKRQKNADWNPVHNFDHACCWNEIWGDILEKVAGENRPSEVSTRAVEIVSWQCSKANP